jgi:Na+/melibiose symporter-like transporter
VDVRALYPTERNRNQSYRKFYPTKYEILSLFQIIPLSALIFISIQTDSFRILIIFVLLSFQVYECCWDKCDYQFEDPADLMEHCVGDGVGCIFKKLLTEADYICIWRNCIRLKRSAPPFPSIARLQKHVREVHVVKNVGRIVDSQHRSK